MTEHELRAIIARYEADQIELTISTKDTEKFSEAVCSFANDLPNRGTPGYLLLGVDDHRRIAGMQISDEVLRYLGGLRDDGNIQPLPSLAIERVVTNEGEVAVVAVQPALMPPVRYRGRICVRIGPRRGYATEHDERILIERRVSRARTFDVEPCLGSSIVDLSLPLFLIGYRQQVVAQEVIAENNRSTEEQLASLRFFDLGRVCPTNAGILLFGLDVRRWLPGAYVHFLRVLGDSLAAPIANAREVAGDLLTVLRDLDALVEAQLAQAPRPTSLLQERDIETYPRVAVRELMMNAILHRDYGSTAPVRVTWFEDRLEIQSPGGLYGEVSPTNFPRQTSYRNPVIAEAMKALGYVNRYGRGVLRAQDALSRNGSRPAEFQFDAGFVLAIIRKRS